jgi:DNA polymerase-3 subunit beta
MKFQSDRDDLAASLATATRAVGSGRTGGGAVLSGLLIDATTDALAITGTDLDLVIRVTQEANVTTNGAVVLPARLATEIVRSLDDNQVQMELAGDQVVISSGRSLFTLLTFPVSEFPKIPEPENIGTYLPAAIVLEAIKQVATAASNDNARPLLTGVLLTRVEDNLRAVATDSYRLSLRDLGVGALSKEDDILVPARALNELQRLKIADDEEIGIALGSHGVTFTVGTVSIFTRLLDGTYPNYQALIPTACEAKVTIEREAFLEALRRVKVMVTDATTPLKLSFKDNEVTLCVKSPEVGEATEMLNGTLEGAEMEMAFNANYLIDGVEGVTEDEVVLEATDPSKPAVIHGVDNQEYKYLIMPIRTS